MNEKIEQFNNDSEIQNLHASIKAEYGRMKQFNDEYSSEKAPALQATTFDRAALGSGGLACERIDQLTVELLLGVRQ